MSEKKLLALLSLFLSLAGGGLVLWGVFDGTNAGSIDLDYLSRHAAELILGVGAIVFGIYTYKGHVSTGALLSIVIGILILVEARSGIGLPGTLVLLGGVLSLITAGAHGSGAASFS